MRTTEKCPVTISLSHDDNFEARAWMVDGEGCDQRMKIFSVLTIENNRENAA